MRASQGFTRAAPVKPRLAAANETIAAQLHTGAASAPATPAPTVDGRKGGVRAVDNHWQQNPQLPAPINRNDMTEAEARAAPTAASQHATRRPKRIPLTGVQVVR